MERQTYANYRHNPKMTGIGFLSLLQAVLGRLDKSQIVALRFASDDELPLLVDRASRESLSADDIKRAIKTWVPDWDRT